MNLKSGLPLFLFLSSTTPSHAFISQIDPSASRTSARTTTTTTLFNSRLPPGLSPFDRKIANTPDTLRKIAASAINQAVKDGVSCLEVEFPPFVGSKTQFDDFDNVSELDANRDWCIALTAQLPTSTKTWLVLPDDKEVELAAKSFDARKRAALFTSIRAACSSVNGEKAITLAWGSTFASTMNKLTGGDGILGDSSCLDRLDPTQKRIHVVCQPGNGGPVEDWINVESLHEGSRGLATTIVINGALDKVRDGYYPALFFPALAKTVPFYKTYEAALFLKPVSDKGLYGWIYRVYPEPWQVVLQTPIKNDEGQVIKVNERVALTSQARPTYAQAVQALVTAASTQTAR